MYPVAITLFGLEITTYGIMVAVAFAFVWWRFTHESSRVGVSEDDAQTLLIVAIVSGMLSARLLHVVTHLDSYREVPWEALFSRQGYAFVGGFAGGAVAVIWWCRRKNVVVLELADLIAPYIAIAHGIGRVGCFLFGCCYGSVCEWPWAVHFPTDAGASVSYPTQGIHPVQLYEAFALWGLGTLLLLARERRAFPGQILWMYLILYGIARFVLEFFRGDDRGTLLVAWLSPSQTLYLLMAVGAAAAWMWTCFGRPPGGGDAHGAGNRAESGMDPAGTSKD